MLMVNTSGFSENADLSYKYYATSSKRAFYIVLNKFLSYSLPIKKLSEPKSISGPFGMINAIGNFFTAVNEIDVQSDLESNCPYFAVCDTPSVDMKVKIVVIDNNKLSETYNKSVEINVGPFQKANLSKDINVPYAMFEGETRAVPELLLLSGVAHIYPQSENCATINSLKISDIDAGTVSVTDPPSGENKYLNMKVTANQAGLAKMNISVSKSETCLFHPGLSGVGDSYIRVFKKPVATPVDDGFDLSNTEKGVTYTIGSQSKTCSSDGEIISFRNLAGNCEYEIICSDLLPNGMKAKASFSQKTLSPYSINFRAAEHPGVTNFPEQQGASRSGLDKAEKPEDPYAPGYVFGEWYNESTFSTLYDFDSLVTSDITLRGKWLPLQHTVVVKLTLSDEPYSNRTVELYQDYEKKYTLSETAIAGTYRLEDAVETGVYDIYVDGNSVYAPINVTGTKCEKDLSSDQLSTLISGETTTASVKMIPLKTKCLLDGVEVNVGEVLYKDEMGNRITAQYVEDAEGKYYYAPTSITDPRVQDIFVNGADSDRLDTNDAAKDISVASPSKVLNFYKMAFVVDIDDSEWTSDNVVLRDKDGNLVTQLTPEAYNSTDGTRTFSAVMPIDEKATPDEFTVFLDGADTGVVLTATESGHSKTVSAYKVTVNVKKDGAAWNDAVVMISNEDYSYNLFDGTDGTYVTALLYDANEEKPYSVSVNATVDQTAGSLSSTSTSIDMDYYSVKYYSYKKGSTDGTYELENTRPYREQTVKSGNKAVQVADPYVEGLTFRCFAKEQWTIGETPVAAYDFDTLVTEPLTLYAHFENPEININGFVKSNEAGEVSSTGECFILPNLTISGFDEGEAIKSILITVSNAENVTFPTKEGVTVNSKDGSHAITFTDKVSMTEAQVYLRNAVFKPIQEKEINLSITVSDGVIDASSETSFTQTQTTENWIKLSSVSGYNTRTTKGLDLSAGNYYVDESVTITNTSTGGSGLRINGNVKLYIPKDVILTANGAAGSGKTGGGAGVYLPSGKNLYLYGSGTLNANGGKGGNGAVGDNGQDSTFSSSRVVSTQSGKGGNGGGGGGAGIGTNGASGADGGASVGLNNFTVPSEHHEDGKKGSDGDPGPQAAESGTVYSNGVTVNPVCGGAGNTMSSSKSSAGSSATFSHTWQYWMGASGGGGNGAPGRAGNNIGSGGSGGAGGGAGGSGAITCSSDVNKWDYATKGGHGGNADGNAGKTSGTKEGSTSKAQTAGDGGNGGTTPSNRPAKSVQSGAALAGYTVTFVGAQGSPSPTSYALNSTNVVVNVPDYSPESGKFFLGWRVSTYGKNVNGQSETKPLTTAETKLYQPGESFTLAELTYGNIELKPVTIEIAGKTDTDKLSIPDTEFVPSALAKNYYNYTVNTILNGTAADIGTIVLKPDSGDSITLGGNGLGVYSLTSELDTTYKIYLNSEDTGVTVAAGTPAEVKANQIMVTTKLNGSASAVPGDVTLVSSGASLSSAPVLSGGEFTGTYRIQKLLKDMPSETEYMVYVSGENTGTKVKAGDDVSVDYYAAEVTIQGNITVDNVILKNNSAGDIVLGQSGSVYSGAHLTDETTVYDVYVNGQPVGKNVKFNSSDRAVTVIGNVLTITARVNGVVSDATGLVPTYKGVVPEKKNVGTYQILAFGEVSPAVMDGTQKAFTDGNCIFDFYTVTYDGNGATSGTAPVDNSFYIAGSKPTVSTMNSLVKDDYQQNGWSISGDTSGKVYFAGDMLPEISEALTLKADWKQLSDYPLVIVKGDEVIYGGPDDIRKIIEERNYPEEGNGTPELTIIVQKDTELPDNLYLGPKDEIIIESPVVVETDNLTNEGKITVEQGAELQINGTLENQGELENDGKVVLEENASFKNDEDGNVENSGTFEVEEKAEVINNGEFSNNEAGTLQIDKEGEFKNSEEGNLDNDGTTVINGTLTNDGNIDNDGSLKTTTTPGGSIDNNKVIQNSPDGTVEVPVENEKGTVNGGLLEDPGSINGGVLMGMDTSEASPNAVKDVKNSFKGVSSTPASGGALPETPTQSAIDNVFGEGNAELLLDDQGTPQLDPNGNYVIVIKKGLELENPLIIPDGVNVTLELVGNKIEGPDGETAIIVDNGTLAIHNASEGGGIFGGSGTTENGGNGDGGNGIEVKNNGKLSVYEDVEVAGGLGVGSGNGGSGILVDLDPEGTGEVYLNGMSKGGNGGSDVDETPGNGGTALEIVNAPEEKVIFGPKNEMDGGIGGENTEGENGESGRDSEIAPEAAKSILRQPITNDDNVEITLLNTLYVTGDTQEQNIQVKVNGVLVPAEDYTISKNSASEVGEYALKVTFRTEIDSAKPYANLAGNSYQKEYEIYKNPVEAPEVSDACLIDYSLETITPMTGYEISLSNGDDFESGLITDVTEIDFSKTYYIRKVGDDFYATSSETAYTPVRPAVPSAPEEMKRTDNSIILKTVSGQEYSIDNGLTWQDSGVFTGLDENTEYQFITRVKATESGFESKISSVGTLTTRTPATSAPDEASISDVKVTESTATLPVSGNPNKFEYSLDGINWVESNEFTDLKPGTEYTFYVREKETDTAMPSEVASVKRYTAAKTPGKGEGYTLNVAEQTITLMPGYEISASKDPFEALTLTNQKLSVDPEKTYYIRKAATKDIPASDILEITVEKAPEPDEPEETPLPQNIDIGAGRQRNTGYRRNTQNAGFPVITPVEPTDHSKEDESGSTMTEETESVSYQLIEGANGEWTIGEKEGLSFTSNAPFEKFSCVKVDDEVIDPSCYTAVEGSTKVTLNDAYLKTLSKGKHTLEIVSQDGSVETDFFLFGDSDGSDIDDVIDAGDVDVPDKSNSRHLYWWLLILLVVAFVTWYLIVVMKKKKEDQNNQES